VLGGEGFFADPRRLWAAGIDDGDSVPEQVDQQGFYHRRGSAVISPSIGVSQET